MVRYLSIAIFLCVACVASRLAAQHAQVWPSPHGVYLFISDTSLTPGATHSAATILRGTDAASLAPIGRLERARTLEEFRSVAGQENLDGIKHLRKLGSDEDAWKYITSHSALHDYGLLALDLPLRQALGMVFLDSSIRNPNDAARYRYALRYVEGNGSEGPTIPLVSAPPSAPFDRPIVASILERDSVVRVKFVVAHRVGPKPFFAQSYRQVSGSGPFEPFQRLLASNPSDSTVFIIQDQTTPNGLYRYFIEPTDLVDNPGPRSDTATAFSIDYIHIPLLKNLTARDTVNGIFLRWTKLEEQPYFIGIQIERSEDASKGFETLDTVSPSTTTYLDSRLVPNKTYYYHLTAVLFRDMKAPPSQTAFAAHKERLLAPTPPQGLKAEARERNVYLSWDSVASSDLAAYYVYRAASTLDSFVIVSPDLLTTHFLDTSLVLSGRTQYVYRVQAVSMSDLRSELSNDAIIRPDRPEPPKSPLGLRGYSERKRIRLEWDDLRMQDPSVIGYRVYRKDAASRQVLLINELPVKEDWLDDERPVEGARYEYYITSVNAFGLESGPSPSATIGLAPHNLRPPSQIMVRMLSAGIEISWSGVRDSVVTGYEVLRRERHDRTSKSLTRVVASQKKYVDASARRGTLYLYSVRSIAGAGSSPAGPEKAVLR